MPVECEFRANGVILWHRGLITGEEVIRANMEIYDHPDCANFEFQLMHTLDVTRFDFSSSIMRRLAEMDVRQTKNKKQYACVIAPSDSVFGMARVWQAHSTVDDFQPHVVRTYEAAVHWFKSMGVEADL